MMSDILVPTLGESVTEATVAKWLKGAGEAVKRDEALVELETDKVSLEVSAPEDGVLGEIVAQEGDTVGIGALLGRISAGGAATAKAAPAAAPAPKPAAATSTPVQSPAVQRAAAETGVNAASLQGSGKDGRVTKGDVLAAAAAPAPAARPAAPAAAPASYGAPAYTPPAPAAPRALQPMEERVRMTRLRQTIARRLKDAQNSAAILTTFNEVDMGAVMQARSKYKDAFERKHGVKLGFMSFFVKACVNALKEIPAVNAEIDGQDLIYKNHYDIGVAVGTDQGLVVPVLRDADKLSIAAIEREIAELGNKARSGKLTIEDMQGGTFTISNGGVYGSLMSTPILNPPQSGVLGMHKIEERPRVVNGQIVARPMMYLALSYDHRIVDGKEAVTFLVRVKEDLEDPERMLLDI
jgi:2-oxoglutarate dehydrogenase E2 component (dihydrolipoamide succinyltransferase)